MENKIRASDVLMKEELEKLQRELNGEEVCWCDDEDDEDDLCDTCASKECQRCGETKDECECCKCGGDCERCVKSWQESEYRTNAGFGNRWE